MLTEQPVPGACGEDPAPSSRTGDPWQCRAPPVLPRGDGRAAQKVPEHPAVSENLFSPRSCVWRRCGSATSWAGCRMPGPCTSSPPPPGQEGRVGGTALARKLSSGSSVIGSANCVAQHPTGWQPGSKSLKWGKKGANGENWDWQKGGLGWGHVAASAVATRLHGAACVSPTEGAGGFPQGHQSRGSRGAHQLRAQLARGRAPLAPHPSVPYHPAQPPGTPSHGASHLLFLTQAAVVPTRRGQHPSTAAQRRDRSNVPGKGGGMGVLVRGTPATDRRPTALPRRQGKQRTPERRRPEPWRGTVRSRRRRSSAQAPVRGRARSRQRYRGSGGQPRHPAANGPSLSIPAGRHRRC